MSDFLPILKNIARLVDLTPDEEEIFISRLRVIPARKKQFIVQPDFVCQHRTYVLKGALQAYILDKEGQAQTIALAVEDYWISDFSSYIFQQPATFFVEVMEDATLIQLSYQDEQELYRQVPKFERFFRLQVERAAAALQKRMLWRLSKSAEERYEDMALRQPQFFQRFPQYVIASYLGMTTQFLSRIRKQQAKS